MTSRLVPVPSLIWRRLCGSGPCQPARVNVSFPGNSKNDFELVSGNWTVVITAIYIWRRFLITVLGTLFQEFRNKLFILKSYLSRDDKKKPN